MPPAPVKDLKIQERESDLVVGTYGRGAFIADIWPLSHSPQKKPEEMFLFPVQDKPQRNCSERVSWGNYEQTGDNFLITHNSYNGLALYSFIGNSLTDSVLIQVCDSDKMPIDTIPIEPTPGYHLDYYNTWDTEPGEYYIRMISGDKILEQRVKVLPSPVWTVGRLTD